MTQDEFDKWVGLLESGEYEQCHGTLRQVDTGVVSYCCLGLYGEKVKGYEPGGHDTTGLLLAPGVATYGVLEDTVRRIAPFDASRQRVLAALNDGNDVDDVVVNDNEDEFTFAEIAKFLRAKGLGWINGPALEIDAMAEEIRAARTLVANS